MPAGDERRKRHSQSRSPYRERAHRSRSPTKESTRSHHKHRGHRSGGRDHHGAKRTNESTQPLPCGASMLTKEHFNQYRPLFAQYLDIQKQLDLFELDSAEAKGRWKSFIKKWNRRELAEGWYDPEMLLKATADIDSWQQEMRRETETTQHRQSRKQAHSPSSSEDEGPGPYPASQLAARRANHMQSGPGIPSMQDLELRREQEEEEAHYARADLKHERKANRAQEKERLEELAPKAMAGTKERQLEKKRERASENRSFADAKSGGDMAEVGDSTLMGGDDGGINEYKKKAKEMERKKNEREIRREEIMRAKQEERQQRAREIQEREDRTMQGLLDLAKQRFG